MAKRLTLECSANIFRLNNPIRHLSTSSPYYLYERSWTNQRRIQNPNIVKEMPTNEYHKNLSKFKKTKLVYVCGLGVTGSLGLEKYYKPEKHGPEDYKHNDTMSSTFRRLQVLSPMDQIIDVACGYGFTLIAGKFQGTSQTVLGFGLNTHSQIGYHASRPGYPLEIVSIPSPIVVPSKAPITRVSCGRSHSLLLNQIGQVFSLGNNSLGQCGRIIDDNEIYFGSKKVHQLKDLPDSVCQIECGQDHSMFLTSDGHIYACGWSADGQTGLGHYDNQFSPARIKGDIEKVKIIKVSSYADTVLALDIDGNVFGWGNSEYSQFRTLADCESEQFNSPRHLKLKNIPGKVVDIAAGGTICAILNDAGQVFVWGFGILGKGPNVDQSSRPVLIPETLFGMNCYNREVKVEKIYACLSHFGAITNRGDLFTWGKNRGLSLGHAHSRDQYFPMQVSMNLASVKKITFGVDHSCAIVEKIC